MQRQRNEDSFGIMGPRIGPPRRREECSRQGLLGRTFLSAGDRRLERGSDVTRFQCTSPPSTNSIPPLASEEYTCCEWRRRGYEPVPPQWNVFYWRRIVITTPRHVVHAGMQTIKYESNS